MAQPSSGAANAANAARGEAVDTVSKACAYGDFDALRRFVETDPSCVNQPDDQGYLPLQWAALNNRVAEANYLLANGAAVGAADPTGQGALHWAAVRGSLPALETLLRGGADPGAADARGYTVCHVAAQYGQTAALFHLAMKWGVDVDAPDADGRTPLHWVRSLSLLLLVVWLVDVAVVVLHLIVLVCIVARLWVLLFGCGCLVVVWGEAHT